MEFNIIMFSILFILGLLVGLTIMVIINSLKETKASKKAEAILEKAQKDAEKIKRDNILEAKEESHKLKIETEKEIKARKVEIRELEERLNTRESNIDKRDQTLTNREQMIEDRENNLINKQREIQKEQDKVEEIKKQQVDLLEKIAGYSKNEARNLVMKKVEDMMNLEIAAYIKDRETEAKMEVDKKAKGMLVSAMQKYAGDVAGDQTVTVVNLPNDDMKGRLIGREGRNIRSIEAVTGVDLIIDDTPEAIVLSSFDPYRREIARVTIESLIKDGRIHPGRIEEIYDKTAKDMKSKVLEYGQSALFELGITKMEPELVELVGKLHFRTSYGQNALTHSIEVGHLAGIMAAELGENQLLAKRAGLLHDIGKAIDHEVEGSHVELGSNLANKYKENQVVINAIESHHGDKEATSVISVLVGIADALSASRPGARNDSLENYVQRLQELEKIGNEMEGVEKSYAMQAGRELRVIVKPDKIDDAASYKVARDIKNKIEEQLQYPGTIKVIVIRETRAQEEAK
ncbi:MAG: ribonuclease Y [Candidatus Faecisoma sp.]|nr:ribonuclease Y [Acholeplasma sp.]MDY2892533.1 ribonuclease Y [Candidatus Faecisoma sp.]CCY27891.1 ribonuclease Y [Acholeplasma sp. CAG:878]